MRKITLFIFIVITAFVKAQTTVTVTINSPGSSSWQVPCGITSITVQCWGGGGAGGGAGETKSGAGGGGSGGYASTVFAVSPGASIAYTVGAGGPITAASSTLTGSPGGRTTFSTTIANGGNGGQWAGNGSGSGTQGNGGAGGTGGIGTTTINGAAGSNGNGSNSSTGGAGGNAPGPGGGTGGIQSSSTAGFSGNTPGGGGSGGSIGSGQAGLGSFGGAGGNGQINIIYVLPTNVNAGSDVTLGTCTSTVANLAAGTPTNAGFSGSWSCSGCSGIAITNSNSASTSVSGAGFTAGSTTTFIWTVTNGVCSYQDEMIVSVPACAQANPECASAQNLPINNPLLCGQNTNGFGGAADGCVISGTGQTVWYRFTVPAATTSLVLSVLGTSTPYPHYGVFSAGCPAACAQNVTYSLSAGDPGKYTLLTGLTPGATYNIIVQSSTTANSQFCIGINNVAVNSTAPANAAVINNCGVTFNGTTNGGYYPSGTSAGFNNLDGNNGTTVAGASEAGDDVTFVINNISWFKFCSVNTGTYNVQFKVTSCVFSGLNSGSQMAILTGTNTNLTNIWQASNPTYPSTALQTSPNFSLAAGGCAYLVVDGFAGDACSYSYVLTNIAGDCILLPVELASFKAIAENNNVLIKWVSLTEINNDYYIIEKSLNGIDFYEINRIKGSGNSNERKEYFYYDMEPSSKTSYYRLKQVDFNGAYKYSNIETVIFEGGFLDFKLFPNPSPENSNPQLSFTGSSDGKVLVTIKDLSGKIMSEKELMLDNHGQTIVELQHAFTKGVYFIDAQDTKTGYKVHQKFIVN